MSEQTRPGFGKRLWRALIRLLALTAVLLVLGGLAAAAYFGSIELQRSFDSVYARIDANEQSTALLRSDVNDLMGNDDGMRTMADLQATITALEAQLQAEQAALAEDIAAQSDTLAALTDTVGLAAERVDTLSADLTMLNDGLAALQGDITENGTRIDALGGELDALSASITALDTDVAQLSTQQQEMAAAAEAASAEAAAAELSELQRALSLFRVSELIARARLRLLENNAGLAQEDVETAVATLDALIAVSPPELREPLEAVQARLALAFVALPDNPDSALTDLETAWDDLDLIFVNEMLIVEAMADSSTEEAAEETAEESAEPTPTPETAEGEEEEEETEEEEATPTPAPTPTPSP